MKPAGVVLGAAAARLLAGAGQTPATTAELPGPSCMPAPPDGTRVPAGLPVVAEPAAVWATRSQPADLRLVSGVGERVRLELVSVLRPARAAGRALTTLLFTDIVGATRLAAELGDRRWRELLERHHAVVRRELARFDGREIDTAGDGFLATFDGPAQAVRCACAIRDAVGQLGIAIRAGVHTGECEPMGEKVVGIAVHIGARVAASAGAGEILVSSSVRDQVAASEIRFEDRPARVLKGIPGEWRLFAVEPAQRAQSTLRGSRASRSSSPTPVKLPGQRPPETRVEAAGAQCLPLAGC